MKVIRNLLELLLVIGSGYLAHVALAPKAPEVVSGIAGTFAAVAGTLMGFLIAALSILTSLTGKALIENMKKTGHWEHLLHRIYAAAAVFLVILALSLVSLFISGQMMHWIMVIASSLMVLALWFLVSTGRTLHLVLKLVR